MVFAKLVKRGAKSGYTLVEVLIVVAIMGVLSAMGVAGLQGAVANARVKDAAVNTAAFLERVATESRKQSAELCIVKAPGNSSKLLVYKSDESSDYCHGTVMDSLVVDSPNRFVNLKDCGLVTSDWIGNNPAIFEPRRGLSAAPLEGAVCIQYGTDDRFGAARKLKTKNGIIPQWKVGSGSSGWMDL